MKQHKSKGFTLIELMVVISLCTLIAYLSTASFSLFDSFIIRAECINLRMFFQKMRYDAISSGKEYIVTLDLVNNRYYTDHYEHIFDSGVFFGFPDGALGPPSNPHSTIHHVVTFKNNQIHFFADGTISAGIIYITDRAKKNGYALSNAVGAVSYLRFYRYDKGKWLL